MIGETIHGVLRDSGIAAVSYVPDAGHAELIERCQADPAISAVVLTTEEEGVALAAGGWLGGMRTALLMQSSGVGNCVNMFSLVRTCSMPFLTLVTMRGEWGEANPWQVPMGQLTPRVLRESGFVVLRVDDVGSLAATVRSAATLAFDGGQRVAVLLSQQLIGAKAFAEG